MPFSASLSLISFGLSAFLAVLLWFDRGRRSETRVLGALLFIHALGFLLRYAFASGSILAVYLPLVVFPLLFLHGPLVDEFVRRSLFGPPPKDRRRLAVLLGPAACLLAFGLLFFTVADFRDREAILAQSPPVAEFTRVMILALGIYSSAFWLRALSALRTYVRRYQANFSSLDSLRLQFLKAFIGFTGAVHVAYIGMALFSSLFSWHFPVTPLETLLLTGLIYLVLYYLVRRPQIFWLPAETPELPLPTTIDSRAPEPPAANPDTEAPSTRSARSTNEAAVTATAASTDPQTSAADRQKYARQSLDAETRRAHLERIQTFMDDERPYLDGDLALADLARAVEIPKHHLSMAINIELRQNFFQFVNDYRVSEARRLLADPSLADETVLNIAYRAGFQSKAAFNKVFKKTTGQTPGQYRTDAAKGAL
ncbi:MAG: AraC family transcriptional regulator [Acidobacteriota bacterium]